MSFQEKLEELKANPELLTPAKVREILEDYQAMRKCMEACLSEPCECCDHGLDLPCTCLGGRPFYELIPECLASLKVGK